MKNIIDKEMGAVQVWRVISSEGDPDVGQMRQKKREVNLEMLVPDEAVINLVLEELWGVNWRRARMKGSVLGL